MKKILLLGLLSIISFSCSDEDEKFCWECQIIGGGNFDKETVCDKTEEEIRDYENKSGLNSLQNVAHGLSSYARTWFCNKK
jgi:hypothetical protein